MRTRPRPTAVILLGALTCLTWAVACNPKSNPDDGGSLLDGGGTSLPCTTLGNSALSSLFQYDGLPADQECAALVSGSVFEYYQRDGGCQATNAGASTQVNAGGFNNPSPGLSIFTDAPTPFSQTGTLSLHVQATAYDAGAPGMSFQVYGNGLDTCDFTVNKAASTAGEPVDFQLNGSCVLAAQAGNPGPAHLTLSQTRVVGPLALFTSEDDGGVSQGACP